MPGNANLIIPTNITTLPKVSQQAGFHTGVVGKWHLGLGNANPINWNKKISPGPKDVGFDYSFIFPATADRTPTVFIENQTVVGLDTADPIEVNYKHAFDGEITAKAHPELLQLKVQKGQGHMDHLVNGIGRIGFMKGGKRAEWTDEELGFTFNQKAISFIDSSMLKKKPFFLYYAIHDIHAPRMPATEFKGKSKLGYRGDAILEMDHSVGVILQALKERNLMDNTIIIFSSDNGPVLIDAYLDDADKYARLQNYAPAGPFRGGKYTVLEGGTKIPFLIYWKNKILPNTTSSALFSQIDLLASFAKLFNVPLPSNEFTDSKNYLKTLLGKENKSRVYNIEQPARRQSLAIVKDNWKYITPMKGTKENNEAGYSSEDQLYNLKVDPKELKNFSKKYPQKLAELKTLLEKVEQQF